MTDALAYTLKELSEVTGIGRTTILHEIHANRLRAFRVGAKGRKWIVPRSAAEAWLKEQIEESQQA